MTRKKNGFWTFVCSLMPGAGEMYMGFFKQGLSLMGAFLLVLFLASWLNIGPLLFVLPLVWFYSFFHVHNLRSLPDEEFYAMEDNYLFEMEQTMTQGKGLTKKWRNLLAGFLILIGGMTLLNYLMDLTYRILPVFWREGFWHLWHRVPQAVFAVLLILGGFCLIRGKKRELDAEESREDGVGQP